MAAVDFKLRLDGLDTLMAKIGHQILQFNEVRDAISNEISNFENILQGPSKNAFRNKTDLLKAGFVGQYGILSDAKKTGLEAKATLKETDAQIASGISVGIW
jgi:hypothetical protein